MSPHAKCPICGAVTTLSADNRWRPFCSEQCRLIDLGEWLDGRRGIPAGEDDVQPEETDLKGPSTH